MPNISIEGIQLEFDNEPSIGSVTLTLGYPDNAPTFSYSFNGETDVDGLPYIDVHSSAYDIRVDGFPLEQAGQEGELNAFVVQATWPQGTTTVFGLHYYEYDDPNTPQSEEYETELYFILDGPTPNATTIAQWEAFDASITSVGLATGAFAAGEDIPWTAFKTYSLLNNDDDWMGTPGDDSYNGGEGDDYIRSSEGDDTHNGGEGYDQVTFQNDPGGVVANLATGEATDGWGDTDEMISIEMLRGSAFDDVLTGDDSFNVIRGLAGDDTLDGGSGSDEVRYDRDANYGGTSGVTVDLKNGEATDGFGDTDVLIGFTDVRGSDFNDVLKGSGGNNDLEGMDGNDKIKGGAGKDTIDGGKGRAKIDGGGKDDVLTGAGGTDKFIFKKKFGDDVITDFMTDGTKEKIILKKFKTIDDFDDLMSNHLSQNSDGDAVISDGNGNTITLVDVAISDLSADDFVF